MTPVTNLRFPKRLAGLREQLATEERTDGQLVAAAVPAMIVSNLENVRYLTGFTGSNGVVLATAETLFFFTDGRYALQSESEVPGFERVILPPGSNLAEAAGKKAKELGVDTIGFEAGHLTVNAYRSLLLGLGDTITAVGRSGVVEQVRAVKEPEELAAIRKATALADAGVAFLQQAITVGKTERAVAWELEVFLRTNGATKLSFESIIGSGPNSALIHGRPSDRVIGSSGGPEFVLCDFGAEVEGYCSDITRTFVVGGAPTAEMTAIYEAVLTAQLAALAAIRPGVVGREIDAIARGSLRDAGFGEMPHGLGHGLGRVVHDLPLPTFSPLATVVLREGVVATVEPGVYIEGLGGVRIEDDIIVTATGIEVLTTASKTLCIL